MNNCKIAFNTSFVSSLTGASISQLNHWDKIGLISPSILQSEGRGSIRLYSYEDIIEAKTVVYLKNSKISIKIIKKAVDFIKQNFPYNRPLKELKLLSNGIVILFTEGDVNSIFSTWIAASRNGQLVMPFIVPFGSIVADIDKTIEHYNKRIEEAETEYDKGETISWDSLREEYGLSNRNTKRSTRRRSA